MIKKGTKCIVNGFGDLAIEEEAREFIGKNCVIKKRCKSGLVQVHLEDKPKKLYSVPERNITFIEDLPKFPIWLTEDNWFSIQSALKTMIDLKIGDVTTELKPILRELTLQISLRNK